MDDVLTAETATHLHTHPSTHTPTHPPIGGGISTSCKSSNRIELSHLCQDLFNLMI